MTKTNVTKPTFKALLASAALSTAFLAAPAQAGPFAFIKKAIKKELSETAESLTESAVEGAVGAMLQDRTASEPAATPPSEPRPIKPEWKTEEGEAAATGQEGGGLWNDRAAAKTQRAKMSQNGTTVETASEVQAPQEEQAVLIVPAVQRARGAARPQRGKMSQNGTTVETASEVQAPQAEQAAQIGQGRTRARAAVYPAAAAAAGPHVKVIDGARPSTRGKMIQNGTTVETANEVQAPEAPTAALAGDEHEITYDVTAGVDRTQHKVAPR